MSPKRSRKRQGPTAGQSVGSSLKRPRTKLPIPSTAGEVTPTHTTFSHDHHPKQRLPPSHATAEKGRVGVEEDGKGEEEDGDEGGLEPSSRSGRRNAAAPREEDQGEAEQLVRGATWAIPPERTDLRTLALLHSAVRNSNIINQQLHDLRVSLSVQAATSERVDTRLAAIEVGMAELSRLVSQGWHMTHTVHTTAAGSASLLGGAPPIPHPNVPTQHPGSSSTPASELGLPPPRVGAPQPTGQLTMDVSLKSVKELWLEYDVGSELQQAIRLAMEVGRPVFRDRSVQRFWRKRHHIIDMVKELSRRLGITELAAAIEMDNFRHRNPTSAPGNPGKRHQRKRSMSLAVLNNTFLHWKENHGDLDFCPYRKLSEIDEE